MSTKKTHMQRRLLEFDEDGLPEAPQVIIDVNADNVYAPGDRGTLIGRIGPVKHREGYGFITRRRRKNHFYRKVGGYAISDSVLRYLLNRVYHIFVHEERRNQTYEFSIRQYVEDGEPVSGGGDKQSCVPLEDARHVWPNHNAEMDVRASVMS